MDGDQDALEGAAVDTVDAVDAEDAAINDDSDAAVPQGSSDATNSDKDTQAAAAVVASVPLTPELISKSLSLIARTGNGLSHAYTRIEVHAKGITTLDGIDKYPHLRYVDCSENAVVSIDALAGLEFLLSVDLHANQLRAIPQSLDAKKYLQHINLAKNLLTNFKIQSWPIATWLNLNENQIQDLSLHSFPELMHLEVRANKLKSIGKLNTPKLQKLYLGANEITTLSNLDDKPLLQILHLRGNPLESLDGLSSKLASLTYLNLRANRIAAMSEIDKLKALPALSILVLSENPIEQIEGYRLEVLMRLPKLERLDKEPVTPEEREDVLAALNQPNEPAE